MGGLRRFIKPPESLERSLELSRHRCRKRTQKRPNYKNLGEEEDEERAAGGGGGSVEPGGEENWDDNSRLREREKGKGTEGGGGGSSKGSRASGETAEGECVSRWISNTGLCFVFFHSHQSNTVSHDAPWFPNNHHSSPRLQTEKENQLEAK